MTLDEIKAAVNAGKTVRWKSPAYTVIRDRLGQYLIAYRHGERDASYIGLTWRDGVTLNGKTDDFYITSVNF